MRRFPEFSETQWSAVVRAVACRPVRAVDRAGWRRINSRPRAIGSGRGAICLPGE